MILFLSPLCRFLSLQIQKKKFDRALATCVCIAYLSMSRAISRKLGIDTWHRHKSAPKYLILLFKDVMKFFYLYPSLYIKVVFKVTSIVNIHILGDNLYVWLYNPVPWYCSYPNFAILCSIFALVLSPMWPSEMRSYTLNNNELSMLKVVCNENQGGLERWHALGIGFRRT
jgi:hypothetical protein